MGVDGCLFPACCDSVADFSKGTFLLSIRLLPSPVIWLFQHYRQFSGPLLYPYCRLTTSLCDRNSQYPNKGDTVIVSTTQMKKEGRGNVGQLSSVTQLVIGKATLGS